MTSAGFMKCFREKTLNIHEYKVAKLAQTAIEYPPMQSPATFNLDGIKAKIEEAIRNQQGQ
jgi:hypothetical protein